MIIEIACALVLARLMLWLIGTIGLWLFFGE